MATNDRGSNRNRNSSTSGSNAGNNASNRARAAQASIRQTGSDFIAAVRQRPLASAAIAASAAGAGAFLWAKRAQIGDQFSDLSETVSDRFSDISETVSDKFASKDAGGSSLDATADEQLKTGAVAYGA